MSRETSREAPAGALICDVPTVRRIGHALNNQLTAVQGYAELLIEQTAPDHPFRQDLESLCAAAQRATEIAKQLMAFEK